MLALFVGNMVLLVASCSDVPTGEYASNSYPVMLDGGVVYSTDLIENEEQDPFAFSGCSLFFEGMAIVRTLDGELGYLGLDGNLIHPRHPAKMPLVKLSPFHCGDASAHFNYSSMYEFWTVDREGNLSENPARLRTRDRFLIPCDNDVFMESDRPSIKYYKRRYPFSEGLAYVCDYDDLWYFVNRNGDIIIENPHFSKPPSNSFVFFRDGVSWVPMESGLVPIMKSGEVLSDVIVENVRQCGNGLDFVLVDGKVGLLKDSQEYLVTPRWWIVDRGGLKDRESMFYRFNESGLAWVIEDNMVYTIDMSGKKLPNSEIPFDREWMNK